MRKYIRKLLSLPTEPILLDYSSTASIKKGIVKAGFKTLNHEIGSNFRSEIKRLARNKEEILFRNGTSEHTSIILSEMLRNSAECVLIYDRDLSGDLLERNDDTTLLDDFKNFLESGKKEIQIIINPNTARKQSVIEKLRQLPNQSRLKVFELDQDLLTRNELLLTAPFFAVSDSSSFRVEEKNDIEARKAICSYRDEEMSKLLVELFGTLRQSSKYIDFEN